MRISNPHNTTGQGGTGLGNSHWNDVLRNFANHQGNRITRKILKSAEIQEKKDGHLVITVSGEFSKIFLEENEIVREFRRFAEEVSGSAVSVEIALKEGEKKVLPEPENLFPAPPKKHSRKKTKLDSKLNPKFTFDRFIVGESNELAYMSALEVVRKPGVKYNPLFIYGGVGLGKTHLLQAIAHKALETSSLYRITYVTAEQFTSEFVQAVKQNTLHQFRIKYRQTDFLLIDDVQFFQSKNQTAEELFNTFNKLFQDGKQMVFSSDRPPAMLKNIEDRMVSRFSSGLLVDIKYPDENLRKHIIYVKAFAEGLELPEDVVEFIASNITNSIRLLEAAVTRLIVWNAVSGKPVNLKTARQQLKDFIHTEKILSPKRNSPDVKQIKSAVASFFGIPSNTISSQKKDEKITRARRIAIYIARTTFATPTKEIENEFNIKSSSIQKACRQIEEELKNNESLKKAIETIKSMVK